MKLFFLEFFFFAVKFSHSKVKQLLVLHTTKILTEA